MLNIKKTIDGSSAVWALDGRLDTISAPDMENELNTGLDNVTELTLDLADLEYVSSAGLRVLFEANQVMEKKGEMKVIHVSPDVMEVFEVTGFEDILKIE